MVANLDNKFSCSENIEVLEIHPLWSAMLVKLH